MVNILGTNVELTGWGFGSGWVFWFTIILLGIIFLAVIGFAGFLYYMSRIYNKKIVVFENIAGQGYRRSYTDRARFVKLGDGGEELMYLLKKRLFRSAYGRKMDKNEYWFAVGQDGYWYNFLLGDLDAKMGMLDIEPIDRDMRYMHVAVRKNIQDRYRKIGFMEKYGTMVMGSIFLVIMLIGAWFMFDKIAETAAIVGESVKTAVEVNEGTKELLTALSNLKSTSGVVGLG